MDMANILMNVGTVLLAIAALPQLKSVWMDRHNLRGYSIIGTLIIFIGLISIVLSFIYLNLWISVAAQMPPLLLWFLATVYSIKGRNQDGESGISEQ